MGTRLHIILYIIMFVTTSGVSNLNNCYNDSAPDSLQNDNVFPSQYFKTDYPWSQGWQSLSNNNPNLLNNGKIGVIGCGYDAMGIWRNIGMNVTYNYNGLQYKVLVNTAWNPWNKEWDHAIDVPAINTNINIKGETYKFYVVLSTGTYYFNL